VETEGEETQLDKSVIEAIKSPLTHLLRNAVGHGIEPPSTRLARGKAAEGRVLLRAYAANGHVCIEVTDDGAGISAERVRTAAIERGLLSGDDAVRLTDKELLELLFVAGFSTARTATRVSGRGVGLDIVRTNLERVSGCVDIETRVGQGTTVRLRIPLGGALAGRVVRGVSSTPTR
jgi:two-component system chemotaxis sensor kinase CheA